MNRQKTYYERVGEAIDEYKKAVNEAIKDLRNGVILDLLLISVILIFVIAAAIWSNLYGFITTLGLGGVNALSQGKTWISTIKTYWNDRRRLKNSVTKLRIEYSLCVPNDINYLNKVRDLITKYFDVLDKAVTK